MILSAQQLFSDGQAITASAASTNYIDLGATDTPLGAGAALVRDIGKGNPIPLLVQVTEVFNNLTSLDIALQVDDNSGFSSPTTVLTVNKLAADLTLGAKLSTQFVPNDVNQRYVRLNYTVNGAAPSTGKITAGIAGGQQTNG